MSIVVLLMNLYGNDTNRGKVLCCQLWTYKSIGRKHFSSSPSNGKDRKTGRGRGWGRTQFSEHLLLTVEALGSNPVIAIFNGTFLYIIYTKRRKLRANHS